jgi:hypothetical protein
LVYLDDGILASPSDKELDNAIAELKQHFNITEEGKISNFVVFNIERKPDGSI